MFEIDFKRWIALLLPAMLRRPLIFGRLRAAVGAVERVYSEFSDMRAGHVFRLTHNGQVCYLRGALNYKFGDGFRIGTMKQEGKWLYAVTEEGEQIPVAVTEGGKGVPVLYSEQMLNMAQNDFVVYVPAKAWGRLAEIEAMVDSYKLITKRAHYVKTGTPVIVGIPHKWDLTEVFNQFIPIINAERKLYDYDNSDRRRR